MYIIIVICIEFKVILFFVQFFFKKNLFIIELVSCNKRRFNKSLVSGQYVSNCNLMKGGFGNMSFSWQIREKKVNILRLVQKRKLYSDIPPRLHALVLPVLYRIRENKGRKGILRIFIQNEQLKTNGTYCTYLK